MMSSRVTPSLPQEPTTTSASGYADHPLSDTAMREFCPKPFHQPLNAGATPDAEGSMIGYKFCWIGVITLLILLLWAASSFAYTPPEIVQTTLPSGHRLYVLENHSVPVVTIDTWVQVGSAEETPTDNGVSHFLEHLLFKGTPTYPVGAIDRLLEARGANFNAATSKDFTHYYITTAPAYFEEALQLHADMLQNATIPAPELDRERLVVQEEINRSLDSPFRKSFDVLLEGLLGPSHPYTQNTLGPKSNIATIPRQHILDYYHYWYQPKHFQTIVVGDIDTETARKLVETAFNNPPHPTGSYKPKTSNPFTPPSLPLPGSNVYTDPNLTTVKSMIGFLTPGFMDRKTDIALDVASMILGQGVSSRLYQALHEDQQLVNEISAYNYSFKHNGFFLVNSEMTPDKHTLAKSEMMALLKRFIQDGITEKELEKAKTQTIKSYAYLTESTDGLSNAIGNTVTIGTLDEFTRYVAMVESLTTQDVEAAVKQILKFDQAYMVEVLPASMDKTASANSSDSSAPLSSEFLAQLNQSNRDALSQAQTTLAQTPTQSADSSTNETPKVVAYTLPNGTRLIIKPTPLTQTISMTMFAKGGGLLEQKPGVSTLAASLMMQGTRHRDAKAFASELESAGLQLGISNQQDYIQVEATALESDFDHMLLLAEDVLANPAFDPNEFAKVKQDAINQLQSQQEKPNTVMLENLATSLYPNHPYGLTGKRLETALSQVTLADIKQYWHQQFQPQHLVIALAGPVDPATMKAKLEQLVNHLPQAASPMAAKASTSKALPPIVPLAATKVVSDQKPEQGATWIGYGWLGPKIPGRHNTQQMKDYASMKVINSLMGDGLSSRLFVELREKQGLAYEIGSFFPTRTFPGKFVMYLGTDPKNETKVKQAFESQITKLTQQKQSADDVEFAKSKLIGSFALAHDSNAKQAFYLGLYETLGVGYEFDSQYGDLIQQVTVDDVASVAQKYFTKPHVLSIVSPQVVRKDVESSSSTDIKPAAQPSVTAN